ncbi:MAG: exodeoxyribonuclease VII small subunit, partial [Fusobacteria bacterium]|nr:exodeoxyribonuclease VII small subunit [Fusobacteriota bacterium]
KITYEELIASVEIAIDRLESGELGLEESIKCYEVALESLEKCHTMINSVSEKFEKITVEKK